MNAEENDIYKILSKTNYFVRPLACEKKTNSIKTNYKLLKKDLRIIKKNQDAVLLALKKLPKKIDELYVKKEDNRITKKIVYGTVTVILLTAVTTMTTMAVNNSLNFLK